MIPIVVVPGTWSFRPGAPRGDWHHPESAWWAYLQAQGFGPARPDPFVWSTELDGVAPWRKHATWLSAAHSLAYYVEALPAARLHIVCHSHGLQPVMMAAAWRGLRIETLTSIASPIRGDVPYDAARTRIRFWQHVHSDDSDWWQVLGGIGDAVLGIARRCDQADRNVPIPGVGHSGLLTDPTLFHHWTPLLETIRGRT